MHNYDEDTMGILKRKNAQLCAEREKLMAAEAANRIYASYIVWLAAKVGEAAIPKSEISALLGRYRAEISCTDSDYIISVKEIGGGDAGQAEASGAEVREDDAGQAEVSGAEVRGGDAGQAEVSGAEVHGGDAGQAEASGAEVRGGDAGQAEVSGAEVREDDGGQAEASGAEVSGGDAWQAEASGAEVRGGDAGQAEYCGECGTVEPAGLSGCLRCGFEGGGACGEK